ncbi:MAG: NAD-dependent malic enzyme [Nitrospirae bacterium]|nr:NAD-dependent malic enzyme [Nitrospirota bacterium]
MTTQDKPEVRPSPGYSFTLRAQIRNVPGMLGKLTSAIGKAGGDIGAIELIEATRDQVTREVTINATGSDHMDQIIVRVKDLRDVRIIHVFDQVFQKHRGGKIQTSLKAPIRNRTDLSLVYTPGVARVTQAIHEDPSKVFAFTIKRNTVCVLSDGSAVLGLGNMGPEAALPVMEGKCALFKEFGGVDAFPLCLKTQKVDDIVNTVKFVAPVFGGFNLEDISAPRCFEIEERLKKDLDVPVFHDDQHGTAVVVLAALINALKVVKKSYKELKVVILGAGAAGIQCGRILMEMGVKNIIACDRNGIIYKGRKENMNFMKEWFADRTNKSGLKGTLSDALVGADLFMGLSGPKLVEAKDIKRMNKKAIVFALSNPTPEIMPEEAAPHATIIATGRSDYPNQINNVLCFPGLFRGVLDCQARDINMQMKIAAAKAIAGTIGKDEIYEDYIIPSVFNKKVSLSVAEAVIESAIKTGVARRKRTKIQPEMGL